MKHRFTLGVITSFLMLTAASYPPIALTPAERAATSSLIDLLQPVSGTQPSRDQWSILSTIDNAKTNFAWNTNCWIWGKYDLSCWPVWKDNSVWSQQSGGVLVTPQEIITCYHEALHIGEGIAFLSTNDVLYIRHVTDSARLGTNGEDLVIEKLDSPLPTNMIHPARVLPPNFLEYFPSLLDTNRLDPNVGPTSSAEIPVFVPKGKDNQAVVEVLGGFDGRTKTPNAVGALITFLGPSTNNPNYSLISKYYTPNIFGDSGSPVFMLGDNGQLIYLTAMPAPTEGYCISYSNTITYANYVMDKVFHTSNRFMYATLKPRVTSSRSK